MKTELQLNYKIIGEGKPVVILHGLFGMLDNLQLMAKGLAEKDYMIFLVDQRDHGRSPHTTNFSYPALSHDLSHFMESQWLHQCILIGHSMGGKTAMQFVVDNPGIVTKLIIIDIGIKKYPGGHEKIFEALLSVPLSTITTREEVFVRLSRDINDEGIVLFLMKNLSRNKDTHAFEWKMNLPLLFKEYENILAPIEFHGPNDTEVLFVRGERSDYIRNEDIPDIQKYWPNSTIVTIPNAGHWVHADNLPGLLKEIFAFLET